MDALSNYYENIVIDHLFRNQAFTPPSTVYVALFKNSIGLEANSGVTGEVTGGDYVRKAVTLSAASSGSTSNSSDIIYDAATADWGTITHIAIVDHISNTNFGTNVNVLAWGALSANQTVSDGDILKLLSGELTLSIY